MKTDNRILRVNMANIRRKIEKNPAQPEYIFTEVGVGYRIVDADWYWWKRGDTEIKLDSLDPWEWIKKEYEIFDNSIDFTPFWSGYLCGLIIFEHWLENISYFFQIFIIRRFLQRSFKKF